MRLRLVLPFIVFTLLAVVVTTVPDPEPAEAASTITCPGTPTPVGAGSPGTPSDGFEAIAPNRLLDTRNGRGGVDLRPDRNCVVRIDVSDVVTADATAIALSVLAVDADERGFLTAYPCGGLRPPTSNVNPRPGVPTPNLAIVTLDTTRAVCIFTNVATHLVVDATGWFAPGGARFNEQPPDRVLDTRTEAAPLPATTVRRVSLAGTAIPAEARAVTANVTVSEPDGDGWLLAYPCTTGLPLASTVNYLDGEDRAGVTMVGLDAGGDLCLYSLRETQVIVDLQGWFGDAGDSMVEPLVGTRIADSRNGTGGWTGRFGPGGVRSFDPVASGLVPDHAYAVTINLIATEAASAGHLRAYPCTSAMPNVSAVNYIPGDEATNMAVVPLGDDGRVCIFASSPVHVVVDAFAAATTPTLVRALSISDFGGFDTSITDYAQVCDAAPTTVELSVRGLPGSTLSIDGATADLDTRVTSNLGPDEAISVKIERDGEVAEYWWRCLPADFANYTFAVPGEPSDGWYLTSFGFAAAEGGSFVVIMDHRGTPVWYKRTTAPVIDAKSFDGDTLAWTELLGRAFGADPAGAYEVHGLDGSLTGEVSAVGSPTDHHELLRRDNGNFLILTYRQRGPVDLTVLGAGFGAAENVLDSVIQEVDPDGNLIWEWDSKDHVAIEETTFPERFTANGFPAATGGFVDLLHINSLDEYDNGDLLVSARHIDAIFRIDRTTGDIEWKLGGSGTNPDGATQLAIGGDPFNGVLRTHDARVLDADTITAFDNRSENGVGQPARAVEYNIDDVGATATLVWELRNPKGGASGGLGSVQRLPDGNTLIDWGSLPPGDPRVIEEFDASGQPVVTIDHAGQIYRVVKLAPDWFDIDALRANAGGTAEPRP